MNNCRRLTRRDIARNAAILNGIVDLPANHHDARILAYGRPTYRLREPVQSKLPIPGHITAWCNSPEARETRFDKFVNAYPLALWVAMLVTGAVYVTLSWVISIK